MVEAGLRERLALDVVDGVSLFSGHMRGFEDGFGDSAEEVVGEVIVRIEPHIVDDVESGLPVARFAHDGQKRSIARCR